MPYYPEQGCAPAAYITLSHLYKGVGSMWQKSFELHGTGNPAGTAQEGTPFHGTPEGLHFRVNTADGPPTESFPSAAHVITHSRDEASAPLKLVFGSVVTVRCYVTFPGHALNKRLFTQTGHRG